MLNSILQSTLAADFNSVAFHKLFSVLTPLTVPYDHSNAAARSVPVLPEHNFFDYKQNFAPLAEIELTNEASGAELCDPDELELTFSSFGAIASDIQEYDWADTEYKLKVPRSVYLCPKLNDELVKTEGCIRITEIESNGGEDQGSEYFTIAKCEVFDSLGVLHGSWYLRIDGYYSSHCGVSYEYIDEDAVAVVCPVVIETVVFMSDDQVMTARAEAAAQKVKFGL